MTTKTPHSPTYPAEALEEVLRAHPGVRLFAAPPTPQVVVPILFPLFDHSENLRIARRVGFNPRIQGRAREIYLQSRFWRFQAGVTRAQQERAWFYLALGLYIQIQLEDDDIDPPPDLDAWRRRLADLMQQDRFFEASSGGGADHD